MTPALANSPSCVGGRAVAFVSGGHANHNSDFGNRPDSAEELIGGQYSIQMRNITIIFRVASSKKEGVCKFMSFYFDQASFDGRY